MRKVVIGGMLAIMLIGSTTAYAAPQPQACVAGAFRQHDMAGTYNAQDMRVSVYPCGGVYVVWRNAYGLHEAGYVSTARLDGGGVITLGSAQSVVFLDACTIMVIKPAEPGYIELITVDQFYNIVGVYRLRKIV